MEVVDEIILVSTDDDVCAAIRDVFEDTRASWNRPAPWRWPGSSATWPSHGLPGPDPGGGHLWRQHELRPAALYRRAARARRAPGGAARRQIPERPGSFRTFCETIGNRYITEFNYRIAYARRRACFRRCRPEGAGWKRRAQLIARLARHGFPLSDLSDDEVAKLHVRHMVGGHGPRSSLDERLYRFEFPELPGALLEFSRAFGSRLEHQSLPLPIPGSDFGRVLAGIQVPDADMSGVSAAPSSVYRL